MAQFGHKFDSVAHRDLPRLVELGDLSSAFSDVEINSRSLAIPGITKVEADGYRSALKAAITSFDATSKKFQLSPFVEGEESLYRALTSDWEGFRKLGNNILILHEDGTAQSLSAISQILRTESPNAAAKFAASFRSLQDFEREKANDESRQADALKQHSNTLQWSFLIIGFLIAQIVSQIFTSRLARTRETR